MIFFPQCVRVCVEDFSFEISENIFTIYIVIYSSLVNLNKWHQRIRLFQNAEKMRYYEQ